MSMREDETTEFKREYSDSIIKTVVAFLNTRGGTIYIGVNDEGQAIGVNEPDDLSRKITQELMDNIRPDVIHFLRVGPIEMNGKDVVQIVVFEGTDKPYYLRRTGINTKGVYVRRGPASVPVSDTELMRLVREYAPIKFEETDSVLQDLTFEWTEKVFAEHNTAFGESQKRTLGFYSGNGRYTMLAYFLSDQNTIGIKMAAHSSKFKETIIAREETAGSVLKQLNDAMAFIESFNRSRTEITGLVHTDARIYPMIAIREAVVNAIVHRDYSIDGPTLISFVGNDLIITSLGGLPYKIGVNDIMDGISVPRNPRLASIFQRLGFIEAYGTGIPRIMSCYEDSLFEPNIKSEGATFTIRLPPTDFKTDDPTVKEVVRLLLNGPMGRKEIEDALGVSRSKATNVLNLLISNGIVVSKGSGRNTLYKLP